MSRVHQKNVQSVPILSGFLSNKCQFTVVPYLTCVVSNSRVQPGSSHSGSIRHLCHVQQSCPARVKSQWLPTSPVSCPTVVSSQGQVTVVPYVTCVMSNSRVQPGSSHSGSLRHLCRVQQSCPARVKSQWFHASPVSCPTVVSSQDQVTVVPYVTCVVSNSRVQPGSSHSGSLRHLCRVQQSCPARVKSQWFHTSPVSCPTVVSSQGQVTVVPYVTCVVSNSRVQPGSSHSGSIRHLCRVQQSCTARVKSQWFHTSPVSCPTVVYSQGQVTVVPYSTCVVSNK